MSLSENIKNFRTSQGDSQKTVAEALSVSVKTISHWETGYTEPSINQLIMLADYFNVTLDELVDRKF